MSSRRKATLGLLGQLVPFTAPIVAMALGLLIGGTVGWNSRVERGLASVASVEPRPDDAWMPVLEERRRQLDALRDEIARVRRRVEGRQSHLADLRSRRSDTGLDDVRTADLEGRIGVGGERLTEAREELHELLRRKAQLLDVLMVARRQLEPTARDLDGEATIREILRSEPSSLVEEAVTLQWRRMITEAQLDVCEGMGRRRAATCRDTLVSALEPFREAFVHCLRSEQAAPVVRARPSGESLPPRARALDVDDRFVGGLYVQLCDPTLPDALR